MKSYNLLGVMALSVTLFIVGCHDSNSNVQQFKLNVVSEFELDEQTKEHLHRMYPLVVDNPGSNEIAFYNYTSPVGIIVTDYDGNFVDRVGRQGRGGDEIVTANNFGFDNSGNIAVHDGAQAFFKLFNRSTGIVNSYSSPIQQGIAISSNNLQMCDNQWHIGIQMFGKNPSSETHTIGVFDTDFNLVDSFGGYDTHFQGTPDMMRETLISVDCQKRLIYTTHLKTPYIQVFSLEYKTLLLQSDVIPASFMLSDKSFSFARSQREMTRFMSQEQSLSLFVTYTDDYIFHIFRNEKNVIEHTFNFNNKDYFLAVYRRDNLDYLGEVKLPSAAIGSTKNGHLILLKEELSFRIQFIEVKPLINIE